MTTRALLFAGITAAFVCVTTSRIDLHGQAPQRAPVALPEGAGREAVQKACTQCHGLELIARSGYSEEGWLRLFSTMVALPKTDADVVAKYLAAHFPEKA